MSDRHADGSDGSNSIDAWFDILSDSRRRFLCWYLMQTEAEIVTHEELVEFVLERDAGDVDADLDQQSVATELRHVHLPKLDRLDAVEYDPRDKIVHVDCETVSTHLEEIQSTIEDIQDEQPDG